MDCGEGYDRAMVDQEDVVMSNCEEVETVVEPTARAETERAQASAVSAFIAANR